MIAGEDLALFERSVAHAVDAADVDAALLDLGWPDALADDPRAAVATLFTAQGRANVTSGALDVVLADGLLDGTHPATGVAVVLPPFGAVAPSAVLLGSQLRVRGLATSALARSQAALVVAAAGEELVVVIVEPASLSARSIGGLDPALGLVEVTGEISLSAGTEIEPVPWNAAVALGRLALAHELIGASRTMLELARNHAVERIQFGVPIASFQAVRHRLAEALVAVEGAEAACDGAWIDGTPLTASIAKAIAGRSARTVARHAQQVLAGVGFTTEHAFHRYARRVIVLDQLLGDSRTLTRDLGRAILAAGGLPAILPL